MSDETATLESAPAEKSMQDISDDIESRLFDSGAEPTEGDDDVVAEGDENLPEGNDTDSDDDEGSEDLDNIAEDEDLTLADYLGIDEEKLVQDDDGNWLYNSTIDGEEKPVSIKELAKSFQLQGHVNNKSIALETERKEFQEQRTKVAEELKERVSGIDAMSKFIEQEIVSDYQSIDWDRLRQESPSEWAALRQEYSERAQKIQKVKALGDQEKQRISEEFKANQAQSMNAHLVAESEKMIMANPTWVDNEVLSKDMGVLKDFVKAEYGFTDEDTNLVTDHRLIGLIQDAHKFRAGTKAAEGKKEVVVPKFQKSNATKVKANQLAKARKVKAKRAAVKASGSTQDVANLLIDRM